LSTDHTVWLPQENEPRELTASSIFLKDKEGLDWAEVVVGVMDGPDPDSGTCWECGYAYAQSKPTILIRTDFRGSGEGNLAPYNLMLSESCTDRIELPFASVQDCAKAILNALDKEREASL
jgi:nucleoside 2-deoxyribosyltransferase